MYFCNLIAFCILISHSCDIAVTPSVLRKRNQKCWGSKYLSSRYHRHSLLEHPSFIMVEWFLAHAPLPIARLATAKSRPVCPTFRGSLGLSPRGTTGWQLTPVWQMRRALPLLEGAWACRLAIVGASRRLRSLPSLSLSFSPVRWSDLFVI